MSSSTLPLEMVNKIVMMNRPIYGYMDELEGLIDALSLTDNPITDIKILIDIVKFMNNNYTDLSAYF